MDEKQCVEKLIGQVDETTKREMEKPIKREDIPSIAKAFNDSLSALKSLPVPIDNDTSGIPIFNDEDVDRSVNKLDVILRLLFVRYRVTRLRFARQFQKYAVSRLLISEMNINSQRENYLRSIRDGCITWNKFESVLEVILGLILTSCTFEFRTLDGGKVSITAEFDKFLKPNIDKYGTQNPLAEEEKKKRSRK